MEVEQEREDEDVYRCSFIRRIEHGEVIRYDNFYEGEVKEEKFSFVIAGCASMVSAVILGPLLVRMAMSGYSGALIFYILFCASFTWCWAGEKYIGGVGWYLFLMYMLMAPGAIVTWFWLW